MIATCEKTLKSTCSYFESRNYGILRLLISSSVSFLISTRIQRSFPYQIGTFSWIALAVVFSIGICITLMHCSLKVNASAMSLVTTFSFLMLIHAKRSIFWIFSYIGIYFVYYKAFQYKCRRITICLASWLGLVFTLLLFTGWQMKIYGRLEILYPIYILTRISMLIRISGMYLFLTAFLCLFFNLIENTSNGIEFFSTDDRRFPRIFGMTIVFLLCWLPYLIGCFPGILGSDSVYELEQQLGYSPVTNHHPVIHQLMIRLCLVLGGTANPKAGIAIYSITQMIVLSITFSVLVEFIRENTNNKIAVYGTVAFFALITIHPYLSITMFKDVPFSVSFVFFTILLSDYIINNKYRPIPIVLFGFLFCTLRNNGHWAFLVGMPIILLLNRDKWKKVGIVFFITLSLFSIYQNVLYRGFNIEKASIKEMLSIPLQQMARTVSQHSEEIAPSECEYLLLLYPSLEKITELYNPTLSDPIKNNVNSAAITDNPRLFIKTWASMGIRHPLCYIESFLIQNYGYWYPDSEYGSVYVQTASNRWNIEWSEKTSSLRQELYDIYLEYTVSGPVSIFYSCGFYTWVLLLDAFVLILKGRRRTCSMMVILLALFLTVIAGPVYDLRYFYPMIVISPLFTAIAICPPKDTIVRAGED